MVPQLRSHQCSPDRPYKAPIAKPAALPKAPSGHHPEAASAPSGLVSPSVTQRQCMSCVPVLVWGGGARCCCILLTWRRL